MMLPVLPDISRKPTAEVSRVRSFSPTAPIGGDDLFRAAAILMRAGADMTELIAQLTRASYKSRRPVGLVKVPGPGLSSSVAAAHPVGL